MGLGFFTHIVVLVFGALVILCALAFVVIDMFGRVDYLKVHFPWLEQILARRSALVVLLLVAVLLLIGDAFELVRKEIPEAVAPPSIKIPTPPVPQIVQLGKRGSGGQTLDNGARVQAAIRQVLRFPNAVQDSTIPPTMIETLLTNETPRKLFNVLMRYDENSISTVPESGPLLRNFLHKYYQFERDTVQFENELLDRIGGVVAVRFRQGWGIYLKYAILRFSGMSKDQVIAEGNFLNFSITWEDAERVYGQLSSDPVIAKRFSNTFSQYAGFIETTNKLTASE